MAGPARSLIVTSTKLISWGTLQYLFPFDITVILVAYLTVRTYDTYLTRIRHDTAGKLLFIIISDMIQLVTCSLSCIQTINIYLVGTWGYVL